MDEAHGDNVLLCEECGQPVTEDDSPGVWIHDADEIGAEAYDLNEDHVARPELAEPGYDE